MLVYSLVLVIMSVFRRSRAEERTGPPLITTFSNQRIVYYRAGKQVVLPCNASGGNIRYKWEKDNSPVEVNSTRFLYTYKLDGGNLKVNTSNKCDGSYICFAVNDYGSTFSDKVDMQTASLTAKVKRKNLTIKVNTSSVLNCNYKSNLPSIVKWKKGNKWIRLDERILMDFTGNLYFTNVVEKDQGVYQCVIKNTGNLKRNGNAYNITVNLSGKKQPVNKLLWPEPSPSDEVGYLSENLALKCIFSGRNPSVKWKTTSKNPKGNGLQKSELLIENLTYQDKGNYTCSSTGAKDIKTYKIKILSRPKWVRKPANVETYIGSSVNFTCEAGGKPRPKIYWFINARQITKEDLKMRQISITKNGITLSIQNVTKNNTMSAQCKCDNGHGYVFTDMYLFVSEIAVEKNTIMTKESQTTYGAAIGGALGGLVLLLLIVGIVLIWRYRKNMSELEPLESPVFRNSAYEQENEAVPTCSSDTSAYETLSSSDLETYETLHAKHSSNIYSEVLDENLNTKLYDDDSPNFYKKSTDEDVKPLNKENRHNELSALKHETDVDHVNKQTFVNVNASQSEIGDENYFVLGTEESGVYNEISDSTEKFGAGEKYDTAAEEHYFVLGVNSEADVVPVNYNKDYTSDKNQNAVEESCFVNKSSSSDGTHEVNTGTCGLDENTDIDVGEENYFVLDKEIN